MATSLWQLEQWEYSEKSHDRGERVIWLVNSQIRPVRSSESFEASWNYARRLEPLKPLPVENPFDGEK